MLEKRLEEPAREMFSRELYDSVYRKYEDIKSMKIALVMSEWIDEIPVVDIEAKYNISSGTIQRVSGGISWIVDAIAGMAYAMNLGEIRVAQLEKLSRRLLNGVSLAGLWMAELRVKGMTRSFISELEVAKITNQDSFMANRSELNKIIPSWLIKRIQRAVKQEAITNVPIRESSARPINEPVNQNDTFKCEDRFHFDGRVEKKRSYLVINGETTSIPNSSFQLLLKLSVQLKKDGTGWLPSEEIARDSAWQNVSRLRKEIKHFVLDENKPIIENDGNGSYRLSVPPENITFNTEILMNHWNQSIVQLVRDIEIAHC